MVVRALAVREKVTALSLAHFSKNSESTVTVETT